MAELLPTLGKHRIFYRGTAFNNNLHVTALVLEPSMVEIPEITLISVGKGFYYYDYDFNQEGTYLIDFYENGRQVASQAYLVQLIVSTGAISRGPNVIG